MARENNTAATPAKQQEKLTIAHARKVADVIGHGLCSGMGVPEPGKMCVEAAVCYALGYEFSDQPKCVEPAVRAFKIRLNDQQWSSDKARAAGLLRVGIAQLGSASVVDGKEFARRMAEETIKQIVPIALRAAASMKGNAAHKDALLAAADRCEKEGTKEAAQNARATATAANAAYDAANAAYDAYDAYDAASYAANAAASAAYAANAAAYARDCILSWSAEIAVQVLTELKSPGAKWVDKIAPKKPKPYRLETKAKVQA